MYNLLFEMLSQAFFLIGSLKNQGFEQPLSKKEEAYYLKQLQHHDEKAREELIIHNLRLVAHIVKKYDFYRQNKEDLLSVGTLGLIKAIDTFDINKKHQLTTYASCCIENEIRMYLRKLKKRNQEVSLSEVIHVDKDGSKIQLEDFIADEEIDIVKQLQMKDDVLLLYEYMKVLDAKEQLIINMHFGLNGYQVSTQKEIAKVMQISRSYVSRIEKRAFIKLYKEFQKHNHYLLHK